MEVHHAHHPSHKKKWTEYLLEFFMLFFAVFLGFLTENVREHKIEHRREKHVIEALKRDLEADTTNLNHVITNMAIHDKWVDSAVFYLRSAPTMGEEKKVTFALLNATIWANYTAPDITTSQIKTSGLFNLIKNDSARIGILNYMNRLNTFIKYIEPLTETRHSMDTSNVSILTIADLRKLVAAVYTASKRGSDFIDIADIDFPIKFKTYVPSAFHHLADKLEQLNYLENDMLGQYNSLYRQDVKLLQLLHKEYPE